MVGNRGDLAQSIAGSSARQPASVPGSPAHGVMPLPTTPADEHGLIRGRSSGLGRSPDARPLSASSSHAQARRLIAAANELLGLAAELDGGNGATSLPLPADSPAQDDRRWLRHARQIYRRRRSRTLFFEESLFGEPAWDLLLDLFIAAKERKQVPVTSACIGAAVPTTTALRWLAILEERGLVVREADPTDARRVFVRLTAAAYGKMVAYFARAAVGDGEDAGGTLR